MCTLYHTPNVTANASESGYARRRMTWVPPEEEAVRTVRLRSLEKSMDLSSCGSVARPKKTIVTVSVETTDEISYKLLIMMLKPSYGAPLSDTPVTNSAGQQLVMPQ